VGVVAVGSVRSCGATTLTVGLAATWPAGRRVLLVELDPAGGTLAAGSSWPAEPSLVSLAAAARHGGDPRLVWEHCHQLPGGAAVLAAPAGAEQTRSALGMLGALVGRLGDLDADVLVDCGRLDPGSPTVAVLEGADQVLLAVRPRLADLHAVATWLDTHPLDDAPLGLVTMGDGPYPDVEIAEALGVEVLARMPWDPDAADALASVPASARQLRLAPLVRAARSLAAGFVSGVVEDAARSTGPAVVKARPRLGSRVLAAWRSEPVAVSANGATPERTAP
jgi:hypothetical protein